MTLALVLFSRNQNRQLAVVEIDEVLHSSACGLQPSIEGLLGESSTDHSKEIEQLIRGFSQKARIRVTVINPDGRVVADSDVDAGTTLVLGDGRSLIFHRLQRFDGARREPNAWRVFLCGSD